MMDHAFVDADAWHTQTRARSCASYESNHADSIARQSCNALMGFGLPASTGKPFVDDLSAIPLLNHDYQCGALHAGYSA